MNPAERALQDAVRRLPDCTDTPRLDAELLMAHALGVERQDVLLDPARAAMLQALMAGEALTAGELDILRCFAENPNRPLSRDWLLETISHRVRDPFDRAIDLRITRIRRKIEPAPDKPTVIRTVRGVGYMFVPPAE